MSGLLANPVVPVANEDDAITTYEELRRYLLDTGTIPLLAHVIEKGDGAPNKAGVEQRREHAERAFDAFRKRARTDGLEVETELLFGTDVAETIHDAAAAHDASAIVFSSRGGGQWLDLVSGNVRRKLISEQDRPVVVLPSEGSS